MVKGEGDNRRHEKVKVRRISRDERSDAVHLDDGFSQFKYLPRRRDGYSQYVCIYELVDSGCAHCDIWIKSMSQTITFWF